MPAGERIAFLDLACAGDNGLRNRVEGLLRAQSQVRSERHLAVGNGREPAAATPVHARR